MVRDGRPQVELATGLCFFMINNSMAEPKLLGHAIVFNYMTFKPILRP